MTQHFYCCRPIKKVFDELENDYIYFSTTDDLNDPMEGFKDIFWLGDAIVWRNFLKHYTLCLINATFYCFAAADQFDPLFLRNFIFSVPQGLPDTPVRDFYQRVASKLMTEPAGQTFVSLMNDRTTPVRRNELTGYLRAIHGFAVKIIFEDFQERGLLPLQDQGISLPPSEELTRQAITMMESVTKIKASSQQSQEAMFETLFGANEATFAQAMLLAEYKLSDQDKQRPMTFVLGRFPVAYVVALDRLVHRDWYVACFTTSADDHSMWSNYSTASRALV
jgi:hypothetical protein